METRMKVSIQMKHSTKIISRQIILKCGRTYESLNFIMFLLRAYVPASLYKGSSELLVQRSS